MRTETKHTPGHWQIYSYGANHPKSHLFPIYTKAFDTMPATLTSRSFIADAVSESDARLIAAAPELLAALRGCVETLDAAKRQANAGCEWIASIEARAAISKATKP